MKIAMTNFHEGDGGGQTTYIMTLANQLCTANMILIIAPAASRLYQQALRSGLPVVPITFKSRFYALGTRLAQAVAFYRALVHHQIDVLHINGSADLRLYSLIRPFLKRKPYVVYTKHNSLPVSASARQRLLRCVDHVIAVCQFTANQLAAAGIPASIMSVVYNGVDTEHFHAQHAEKRRSLRQHYQIRDDERVLGSVAGTASYKNWPALLRAVSQLPRHSFKIIIAGTAIHDTDFQQYVLQNGLKDVVIFPGLFDDVREIIPAFDVGFVLSNAVETISFAAREMMSMGIPVMVSDFAGLPENISPGHDGWVLPCHDVTALVDCCSYIQTLSQRDLQVLGENARQKAVDQFSVAQFIDNTRAVYRRSQGVR